MNYYHFDQLGSTRLLTSSAGAVTDEYSYDAYGALLSHDRSTGSVDQPYQYVGQLGYYTHYRKPNFGLLQLGVRFYGSEVGRFGQIDPLADLPVDLVALLLELRGEQRNMPPLMAESAYTYVSDNPLVGTDATGLLGAGQKITSAVCRAKCEESGYNPTLCRAACKLLKNCTCVGLKSLIMHLFRHGQRQMAEALEAVYFGLDCDKPGACTVGR